MDRILLELAWGEGEERGRGKCSSRSTSSRYPEQLDEDCNGREMDSAHCKTGDGEDDVKKQRKRKPEKAQSIDTDNWRPSLTQVKKELYVIIGNIA